MQEYLKERQTYEIWQFLNLFKFHIITNYALHTDIFPSTSSDISLHESSLLLSDVVLLLDCSKIALPSVPFIALEIPHFRKDHLTKSLGMNSQASTIHCGTTKKWRFLIRPVFVSSVSPSVVWWNCCSKRPIYAYIDGLKLESHSSRHNNQISSVFKLGFHQVGYMPFNESNTRMNRSRTAPGRWNHTFWCQSFTISSVIQPFSWTLTWIFWGKVSVFRNVFLLNITYGGSLFPSAVMESMTIIWSFSFPVVSTFKLLCTNTFYSAIWWHIKMQWCLVGIPNLP